MQRESPSDAEGEEDASYCWAAKIGKLTRGATGCGLGLRRWVGNAQTLALLVQGLSQMKFLHRELQRLRRKRVTRGSQSAATP